MHTAGSIRQGIRRHLSCMAFFCAALATAGLAHGMDQKGLSIAIDTANPLASFMPDEAFGAGLDGLHEQNLKQAYTTENIKIMAKAPYNRLSYRLRTELGIEVWHWNETGTWSDEAKKEGYWTSSAKSEKPILKTYGYRLPRRGSTIDQAGNDGYSRLDDGDEQTFWKSNPYLDTHFTGDDNVLSPQWIVIDLGERCEVNALRILWGEPYATRYEVQYWDGEDSDYMNDLTEGTWRTFEHGHLQNGQGIDALQRLSDTPVSVRFVRVQLLASSGTAPQGTEDVRDRLGFAVRELFMGVVDEKNGFRDLIRHSPSNKNQTIMVVSSTDPWHRKIDRNRKTAQPGFDLIISSGLGKGKPVLTPVPILYNTPENAAAQIRFLKSRRFPMRQIEMGEEPDGQNTSPEHYGALYLQFAKTVHEIDPALITGGPGFQSEIYGWNTLADANGEHSWMKRFLDYLRQHNRLSDFGFFSFEWYPFDNLCDDPSEQLIAHRDLMQKAFARLDREGVPRDIPWIISEYGYSSFAGKAEVELPAALLNAEIVAQFLGFGGKTAYYYGLEPNTPISELDGCGNQEMLWGNLMMFQTRPTSRSPWKLPAFYGGKMLVEQWAEPTNKPHRLFPAKVMDKEGAPDDMAAYVVHRPDKRWAVMVLNKGRKTRKIQQIQFIKDTEQSTWIGPLDVIQYSPRQYIWKAGGANGHPRRSRPPRQYRAVAGIGAGITLPPLSLTVLRGANPQIFSP